MLASNSNQISSFPFMNQISTSLEKSFQIHDENENAITILEQQQHHSSSLQFIDCYNYNPFVDEEFILGHILYSQKQQCLGTNFGEIELESGNNINEEITQKKNTKSDDHGTTKKGICRKMRNGKSKDRHSKICTSKGPRDRRMRLSLEIARSFFDLQDMLGFDKASKTVEWLFAKSRSAIKELKEKFLQDQEATKSGCIVRNFSVYDHEFVAKERKSRRKLRIVDKESRFKARARARERTREKLIRRFEKSRTDFEANPIRISKKGEEISEQPQPQTQMQTHFSLSTTENGKILGPKVQNSASLSCNHCENKFVSKERSSDQVHLPAASSMDMGTVSFDNIKTSPPGLKLLELDEIDRVLIFYGE